MEPRPWCRGDSRSRRAPVRSPRVRAVAVDHARSEGVVMVRVTVPATRSNLTAARPLLLEHDPRVRGRSGGRRVVAEEAHLDRPRAVAVQVEHAQDVRGLARVRGDETPGADDGAAPLRRLRRARPAEARRRRSGADSPPTGTRGARREEETGGVMGSAGGTFDGSWWRRTSPPLDFTTPPGPRPGAVATRLLLASLYLLGRVFAASTRLRMRTAVGVNLHELVGVDPLHRRLDR